MLKKVTKEEFYNTINPLDVNPTTLYFIRDNNGRVIGSKSLWKLRNQVIIGESIHRYLPSKLPSEYYLYINEKFQKASE